jgi:hypothetical protein
MKVILANREASLSRASTEIMGRRETTKVAASAAQSPPMSHRPNQILKIAEPRMNLSFERSRSNTAPTTLPAAKDGSLRARVERRAPMTKCW